MSSSVGIEQPQSLNEILRGAGRAWNDLDAWGCDALRRRGDGVAYTYSILGRAAVLIALPVQLRQAAERGAVVPTEVSDRVAELAAQAIEGLAAMHQGTGSGLGVTAALHRPNSRQGDPNLLEELADQYNPVPQLREAQAV
jgi:hypothetical protein